MSWLSDVEAEQVLDAPKDEDHPLAQSPPVFNAPSVVLAAIAVLAALHFGRDLLSPEDDQWVILVGAFIPSRYSGDVLPGGSIAKVTSFVTHMGLHGDYAHLAVNCGWLLAFGSIVGRRIGAWRFVGLSLATGIAGALAFLASNWGLAAPMVGASGAISGLMGAAVRFMFSSLAMGGRDGGLLSPRMSLAEVFRDPRARLMIGSWVALNLFFGLVLGTIFSAGGIAWEAHLGGFAVGLLLFDWFDRQGPVTYDGSGTTQPPLQ